MKKLLFITLGILFSASCYAGVFKATNDQGQSDSVQVLVLPGKVAQTYNPKTGEVKEIKVHTDVKSEK